MLRQTSEPLSFHCVISLLRRFTLRTIGSIVSLDCCFRHCWLVEPKILYVVVVKLRESVKVQCWASTFYFSFFSHTTWSCLRFLECSCHREMTGLLNGVSDAVTFGLIKECRRITTLFGLILGQFGLILGQFGSEDFPRKMMFYSFGEFGCGNVSRCHLCANGNQQSVDLCTD